MKATLLAILGALALVAPAALTASPLDPLRAGAPGADTPGFQALEPCKYGTPPGATVYAEDFEAGLGGWGRFSTVTRPNLWHWSTFAGNNSAMDHLGHGGPGRLYYGIENAFGGTFNTDPVENRGEIRSPPITVPDGVVAVNLNTKWHVEWDRPTIYDGMMFGYVTASGTRTLLCFFGPWEGDKLEPGIGYYVNSPSGAFLITGCKTYPRHYPACNDPLVTDVAREVGSNPTVFDLAPWTNLWEPRFQTLPASLAGQTIQLTFYFQEGDALINDATGWMVDDVAVVKLA